MPLNKTCVLIAFMTFGLPKKNSALRLRLIFGLETDDFSVRIQHCDACPLISLICVRELVNSGWSVALLAVFSHTAPKISAALLLGYCVISLLCIN